MLTTANGRPTDKYEPLDGRMTGTERVTVFGAPWQQADTTLIGDRLGWSPKISLEQSLSDSWAAPG
jgi:hypothetical protein